MKKLIVVANDLERSGKSVVSRALSAHLSEQEIKHIMISSDENDMNESFEGEYWDLEDQFESSDVIAALDTHDAVIFDVQTGAARIWGEFCEAVELDVILAEMDAEMTLVIPDTGSERCNEEIIDLGDIFSDCCDYVICHLPIESRGGIQWKGSDAAKAARNLGAIECEVEAFSSEMVTAVEDMGVGIVSALNQPASLPRFAEVQVCQWLASVGEALCEAEEYLLPEVYGDLVLDY